MGLAAIPDLKKAHIFSPHPHVNPTGPKPYHYGPNCSAGGWAEVGGDGHFHPFHSRSCRPDESSLSSALQGVGYKEGTPSLLLSTPPRPPLAGVRSGIASGSVATHQRCCEGGGRRKLLLPPPTSCSHTRCDC